MKRTVSIILTAVLLILSLMVPADAADAYSLIGDADGDDAVTILDATRVQRALAGLASLSALERFLADVDGSGGMTVLDATFIQRKLADIDDDFYTEHLRRWQAKITSVSPSDGVSPLTAGSTVTFRIEEEYHVIRSEFEIFVDGILLRGRDTDTRFTYTFAGAGVYRFSVAAYDPFGGCDMYSFEMSVRAEVPSAPQITSAVYNKSAAILSVAASGGTAPYQYRYIIRIDVSPPPGSEYVSAQFDFTYDENGVPILKRDFCDDSAVEIPTDLLTGTLNYTCEVQVRDALGSLSEIKLVPIVL